MPIGAITGGVGGVLAIVAIVYFYNNPDFMQKFRKTGKHSSVVGPDVGDVAETGSAVVKVKAVLNTKHVNPNKKKKYSI